MPSVAEVEKWRPTFLAGLTGLLCSLIVRLRDLPFAVDHIGETGSDFINDFFFQVPQSEPVFSDPDEEDPDFFITNFGFVPPSPSQLESVFDFPASDSAASNFEKISASVNASEHLEIWKARVSNVATSHQSIKNRDQFGWTRMESRLVFSDPIKERLLPLRAGERARESRLVFSDPTKERRLPSGKSVSDKKITVACNFCRCKQ